MGQERRPPSRSGRAASCERRAETSGDQIARYSEGTSERVRAITRRTKSPGRASVSKYMTH